MKKKVYIDFGNHPGKDRSVKFYEDVPIESEFKFDAQEKNIPLILKKIDSCFKNYDEEIVKFETYRESIKIEQSKFIDDIKNIFQVEA